jgi:hypothetical protein
VLRGFGGPRAFPQGKPSDDYLESLDMLDNVVRECLHVSRSFGGIPSRTSQHFYASVIFTAMCGRGVSMAILAPCSPWASKIVEHWDYASLTGIARTMLELRLAFCTENVTKSEWNCRWNVFNLHDCHSRIRLFRALAAIGEDNQEDQINGLTKQANGLRGRLRRNKFFLGLPEKKQKRLLTGEQAYVLPLEDIAEDAGVGRNNYKFFQVLLSSHIHGLPMSFYRLGEGRGRGLPTPVEEHYTAMCFSLCATLLTATRDEMKQMFEGLSK